MTAGTDASTPLPHRHPAELAGLSARALRGAGNTLCVSVASAPALLLGAFQRSGDAGATALPRYRRGTGGPAATVHAGDVHVVLGLSSADALVPCDGPRLLNRHVRPLLRALGRCGCLDRYYGREWIAVRGRPAGLIAAGHDGRTGRYAVEMVLGVAAPYAEPGRGSFLGKEPTSLAAAGLASSERLGHAIRAAYQEAFGLVTAEASEAAAEGEGTEAAAGEEAPPLAEEPPWAARVEEAIGPICAGRDGAGRWAVGGELMASVDAVARLGAALDGVPDACPRAGVERIVEETFAEAYLEGVRSLTSLVEVVLAARLQLAVQSQPAARG